MKKIIWSIICVLLACAGLGYLSYRLQKPSVEAKKKKKKSDHL